MWRNGTDGCELKSKDAAKNSNLTDRSRGTSIERHTISYPTYAHKAFYELETQNVKILSWIQVSMLVRMQSLHSASKCACMCMCTATGPVCAGRQATASKGKQKAGKWQAKGGRPEGAGGRGGRQKVGCN